jgi:hypothetical protein
LKVKDTPNKQVTELKAILKKEAPRLSQLAGKCSNCDKVLQLRIENEIDCLRREFRQREESMFVRLKQSLNKIGDELEAKVGTISQILMKQMED